MKAYLFSLEPRRETKQKEQIALVYLDANAAGAWKRMNFRAGRFIEDTAKARNGTAVPISSDTSDIAANATRRERAWERYCTNRNWRADRL